MTEADVQTLEKQIGNKADYEALVWITSIETATCRLHFIILLFV